MVLDHIGYGNIIAIYTRPFQGRNLGIVLLGVTITVGVCDTVNCDCVKSTVQNN